MFILSIPLLFLLSVSKTRDETLATINIFIAGVSIMMFFNQNNSMLQQIVIPIFWLGVSLAVFNIFIRELSIFQSGKEGRYVINSEYRAPKIRFIKSFSFRALWLSPIFLWLSTDNTWLVIGSLLGFGYLVVFTIYEHESLWINPLK